VLKVLFGSLGFPTASAMSLLIIVSIGSDVAARAFSVGVAVSIFADRADLGWFSGSLALNRWMR